MKIDIFFIDYNLNILGQSICIFPLFHLLYVSLYLTLSFLVTSCTLVHLHLVSVGTVTHRQKLQDFQSYLVVLLSTYYITLIFFKAV